MREAFATVPRERFVGPAPWEVFTGGSYESSSDAQVLYQDALIALAPERRINNGQPSLHALCLAAIDPRHGETAVHVGAGTGYYSAILAELVGAQGRVEAYEIEPDLAARAAASLGEWPQAHVHAMSGDRPGATDILYVSASVSDLPNAWLDALAPGGRLLVPLSSPAHAGAMLLARRLDADVFAATFLCRATFIPCTTAQSSLTSASLDTAFASRSLDDVRSLRRGPSPDHHAWVAGRGWWLSTAPP